MEQETVMWIKKEEPDVLTNEPATMFLQDPLKYEDPSLHVKQEVELKLDVDGSEQKVQVDPSSVNIKEEMEDDVNQEFLEDPLRIDDRGLHMKQDPELQLDVDGSKHNFLEDPLQAEDPGFYIKEEPELQLDLDESEHNVVASRSYASNSTRLLQSSEMCDFPFEETISPGVSHSDLEIGSEEATRITVFREGEEVEKEVEEEEEESLAAPRLECSWGKNKFQIFRCNFCLQSFSSKYRLVVHVFVHIAGVQPPKYVCKSCGEVFPSYVSLKKHLKFSEADQESSPDKEETFDSCGAHGSFFLQDDRKDSALDQTARQCFSYETRKSITDKCNTHIPTYNAKMRDSNDNNGTSDATGEVNASTTPHLGKRSHKCNVCGKSFTRSDNLKTHAFIHTGIRPHKCDVCGKSFRRLRDLKTHAFIHTGTNSRKCDICGKSFTPHYLKIHELLHTGISPYKCNICGKSFTWSSNLKRHTLIHTVKKTPQM